MVRWRLRALHALLALSLACGGPLACTSLWQGGSEENQAIPEDEPAPVDEPLLGAVAPEENGDPIDEDEPVGTENPVAGVSSDGDTGTVARGDFDPGLMPEDPVPPEGGEPVPPVDAGPEMPMVAETGGDVPAVEPLDETPSVQKAELPVVPEPEPSTVMESVPVAGTPIAPVQGKFARLNRKCFLHEAPESASGVLRTLGEGIKLWTEPAGGQWTKVSTKAGAAYVFSDCFAVPTTVVRGERSERIVRAQVPVAVSETVAETVAVREMEPETVAETGAMPDESNLAVTASAGEVEPAPPEPPEPPAPPAVTPVAVEAAGPELGFGAGLGAGLILLGVFLAVQYARRPRRKRNETVTYV